MAQEETFKLRVAKGILGDVSRNRIRLHPSRRLGAGRYGILKVTAKDQTAYVSALGHSDDDDTVRMDLDMREFFNVELARSYEFTVSRVGWYGKLRWFLESEDPAVHIAAWLAVWSVVLGGMGAILGAIALWA